MQAVIKFNNVFTACVTYSVVGSKQNFVPLKVTCGSVVWNFAETMRTKVIPTGITGGNFRNSFLFKKVPNLEQAPQVSMTGYRIAFLIYANDLICVVVDVTFILLCNVKTGICLITERATKKNILSSSHTSALTTI